MEQEEIFKIIQEEYPEYTEDARLIMEAGEDLNELLSVLNSSY